MDEQVEPPWNGNRHRTRCGWRIDDSLDCLRVGPVPVDSRGLNRLGVGMVAVFGVGLVGSLVLSVTLGSTDRLLRASPLYVIGMGVPSLLIIPSLIHFGYQSEHAKGPVFELDRSRRVVILLRNRHEFRTEDVLAVGLVFGWCRYVDKLQRASELSLIVARPGEPPLVLVFLIDVGTHSLDALAQQIATALGCPIRRERLGFLAALISTRRRLTFQDLQDRRISLGSQTR